MYKKNRKWTPAETLMNTLMAFGDKADGTLAECRKDALRDEVKGIVIDTCLASDTMIWETGIQKPKKHFVVVEDYPDKKEAKRGHAKWIKHVKAGKKLPEDIHVGS